ncbi:FimV/HubP family polar landmark protein, partial [Shewanella sp. 125m-7]
MNFRTSHLVGLIATGIVAITAPSINSVAAEPLKITGPDGQVKQSIRQYGPTTSADTFWSIAQGVKPDNSVTVYQVMTALYDANPHAFSSKNYNSLERGMILLVPSKAVMLQTSQADAKARAERNDRRWTSSPVAVKPSVTAKTVAPTSVSPRATPKPAVVAKHNPLIAELSAEVAALTKQMEDIQAQNLALTDELARASDEIVVGSSDTAAFQDEISQLKEENALLKQALQDSKSENEALNQQLQLKQQQLATAPEPQLEAKQEPTSDLWRTILDNPLLLVLGAVLPALLVIMLFWLFIRRRNDAKTEEPSADDAPVIEKHSDAQADGTLEDKLDDADGLAVHLDTDDSSSMTPLKGALAADAFAEEQDIVVEDSQDEGQSLDDLWAEAMGEQDQNETDEFDAFNNTLTTASSDDSASMSSDEADLDSLLAGFDEPAEQEQEQQLSGDKDDDLDALLAGFEHDDDQVVQLEQSNETGVATEDDIDDIDALLADFDTSNPEASAEDDLDALLAGFEHDNDQVVQLEQSNETGVATEDDIDDIDA